MYGNWGDQTLLAFSMAYLISVVYMPLLDIENHILFTNERNNILS